MEGPQYDLARSLALLARFCASLARFFVSIACRSVRYVFDFIGRVSQVEIFSSLIFLAHFKSLLLNLNSLRSYTLQLISLLNWSSNYFFLENECYDFDFDQTEHGPHPITAALSDRLDGWCVALK